MSDYGLKYVFADQRGDEVVRYEPDQRLVELVHAEWSIDEIDDLIEILERIKRLANNELFAAECLAQRAHDRAHEEVLLKKAASLNAVDTGKCAD